MHPLACLGLEKGLDGDEVLAVSIPLSGQLPSSYFRLLRSTLGLIPDPDAGTLVVRLHGMANGRSNRALVGLCTILNSYETRYPGTDLRLVLEAPTSL